MKTIFEISLIYDYKTATRWWSTSIELPYKFTNYYLFRYYNARFKKIKSILSGYSNEIVIRCRSVTRNNYTSIQCKLMRKK